MRKELQLIELVERYLRKELSKEELATFELKLKLNESLQNEVESQKKLLAGIERIGVKQDIQTAKRKYFNRYNGLYLGITMIVALTCVVYYFSTTKDQHYKTEETIIQSSLAESDSGPVSPSTSLIKPIVEIESNEFEGKTPAKSDPIKEVESKITAKNLAKFKLPEMGFQYFKIAQNKDTTLKGAAGTIIEIQANSFTTNESQLTFRLKEYYDMSDMVYSNLSTTTNNNEMLETGGMLYIDVLSSDGQKLELKKNKKIKLKFPFENKKPGMQLFNGVKEVEEVVVWSVAKEPSLLVQLEEETINSIASVKLFDEAFTIVEEMPRYPTCKEAKKKEMQKCTEENIASYVKENFKFPIQYLDRKISGTVFIRYTIDERGFISNPRLIRGINSLLNKEVLRVINTLPRFIPGKQRGRNVPVQFSIPIRLNSTDFDKGYSANEIKVFDDSVKKVRNKERSIELEDILSNVEQGNGGTTMIHDIEYYVFASSNLGWINCDRFLNSSRKKINYVLTDFLSKSHVRIIFHSTKSLMSGSWKNGNYSFPKLPIGEKVTIFAIKEINGVPYLCLQEAEISADSPLLEFKKASEEDIRACTIKINSIHG